MKWWLSALLVLKLSWFSPLMKIRPNFPLVHKLDCFSRRLNQKVKTLAYAFLHPWVGHTDKTSSKLTVFCSRKLRFFTSSFTWTSMPCFALRKAYWRYISASREFARLWAFQPSYRLIWTKVVWKSRIQEFTQHHVHSINIVHRRGTCS